MNGKVLNNYPVYALVMNTVSFIIPTLNEGEMLRQTIDSLEANITISHEIIVVDNGSTDGSTDFLESEDQYTTIRLFKTGKPLGVGGAKNFGAAFAVGEFIVFVDGHVLSYHDWVTPLLNVLSTENVGSVVPAVTAIDDHNAIGFGMTWTSPTLHADWLPMQSSAPYPIPLSAGLCQAFRWDFFHEIGGFDAGMVGYGHEDLEICLRTWLFGKMILVVPNVYVAHRFRSSAPYEIKWTESNYNLLRMIYAHFSLDRIDRTLDAIRDLPEFDVAMASLNVSDIWSRRRTLEVRQKYDDNWFCEKFSLSI